MIFNSVSAMTRMQWTDPQRLLDALAREKDTFSFIILQYVIRIVEDRDI